MIIRFSIKIHNFCSEFHNLIVTLVFSFLLCFFVCLFENICIRDEDVVIFCSCLVSCQVSLWQYFCYM